DSLLTIRAGYNIGCQPIAGLPQSGNTRALDKAAALRLKTGRSAHPTRGAAVQNHERMTAKGTSELAGWNDLLQSVLERTGVPRSVEMPSRERRSKRSCRSERPHQGNVFRLSRCQEGADA